MNDGYIGTWVGVNDRGIIRSAHVYRGSVDNDHARQFVSEGGLRAVRLRARNIILDSPLADYLDALDPMQ